MAKLELLAEPEQETDLRLPCEEGALRVVSAGLLAVLGVRAPRQCLHLILHLQADCRAHSRAARLGQKEVDRTWTKFIMTL